MKLWQRILMVPAFTLLLGGGMYGLAHFVKWTTQFEFITALGLFFALLGCVIGVLFMVISRE